VVHTALALRATIVSSYYSIYAAILFLAISKTPSKVSFPPVNPLA
jgi:hypothetical protein